MLVFSSHLGFGLPVSVRVRARVGGAVRGCVCLCGEIWISECGSGFFWRRE